MLLKGSAVILLVLLSCAPLRNLYAHIELTGSLCTCMQHSICDNRADLNEPLENITPIGYIM